MATPIDPNSLMFLLAESRSQPMHVAGMQLFEPPADAGPDFAANLYQTALGEHEVAPLFKKRPIRSIKTAGQWMWIPDEQFDVEHHVRRSALPTPGRVRELLELVSRLHGTTLDRERPLWETHIIEGMADGRLALYTKIHHSLVDGVAATRLMQNVLSTDPDKRKMPLPFAVTPRSKAGKAQDEASKRLAEVPISAARSALGMAMDAAGMPAALVRTLSKGARGETSAVSFSAPKTMLNVPITGSRRFAAQTWEMERFQAIRKATGTSLNDVVLAMCSGALRRYLLEHNDLPDSSLVAMVPVGLRAKDAHKASSEGGNAVGSVMARLATQLDDPAERLDAIHHSMQQGKEALQAMTPNQILAMSALGMVPAGMIPLLGLQNMARPPFNLIISNVPGPKSTQYFNGAELVGSYPVSVPMHGVALNITCTTYAEQIDFGLTGCRRSVPHLQRLLTDLDDELAALENAVGA